MQWYQIIKYTRVRHRAGKCVTFIHGSFSMFLFRKCQKLRHSKNSFDSRTRTRTKQTHIMVRSLILWLIKQFHYLLTHNSDIEGIDLLHGSIPLVRRLAMERIKWINKSCGVSASILCIRRYSCSNSHRTSKTVQKLSVLPCKIEMQEYSVHITPLSVENQKINWKIEILK